jgi:polysaccharide pyruvyl transferase WcaK-like protein
MRSIVVKGAYGEFNFGDDTMMHVLENFFIKNGYAQNVVFATLGDSSYCNKLLRTSKAIKLNDIEIVGNTLTVYGGGTQFFTFSQSQPILKRIHFKIKNSSFSKLYNEIKRLVTKKSVEKEAAAIGIGLGPFKVIDRRIRLYKKLIGAFHFVAVRDQVSYKYCKDWNVNSPLFGADICYSRYLDIEIKNQKQQTNQRKQIGVIVRDWIHENEGAKYFEPLQNTVASAAAQYDFTYIVFSKDQDIRWMSKLSSGANFITWNPDDDSINNFLNILDDFDGFITARYHGGVFASILNRPTICVEIEPKLKILSEQIEGFKLWSYPFEEKSLKSLLPSLDNSQFNCVKSVEVLKKLSDNMFFEFNEFLKKKLTH